MISSINLKYSKYAYNRYYLDKWPDNQELKSVKMKNSNKKTSI